MLRNASLFPCAGLLLFTVACSDQAAPSAAGTRDADVKAVRDVEAAWSKDAAACYEPFLGGGRAFLPLAAAKGRFRHKPRSY